MPAGAADDLSARRGRQGARRRPSTTCARRFRELLEVYNERVAAVEADTSLLVEIPGNLAA